MDRKKELKELYKQMKTEMGVFIFRCNPTGKVYIACDQDIRGTINSFKFRLAGGNLGNRRMQDDWNQYGEGQFTIETVDTLDYDKDGIRTDYREDLAILMEDWKGKYDEVENIR